MKEPAPRDLTRNEVWAGALVEELARLGVTDVCLAPGSRSAPLVLAAVRLGGIRLRVHLDERSAAFFALGLGKASGRPAAVLTTSGTAVANLLPAVVEASLGETPLLLVTADRPAHLRDSDANQAMDQVGLFGRWVRESFDLPPPALAGPELRWLRAAAGRAVAAAVGAPAGPVHVNVPFDKPLEPAPGSGDVPVGFAEAHPLAFGGRPGGSPFVRVGPRRPRASGPELRSLGDLLSASARGVIVAGPSAEPARTAEAVLALGAATGFPVLADPLSGARFRPSRGALRCGAYDLFLRAPALRTALAPDLVLRVGRSPTSQALLDWLAGHDGVRHVVVDAGRRWKDHLAVATDYLPADPADALGRLAEETRATADPSWRGAWERVEARALAAAAASTGGAFFEGSVLAEVAGALPEGGRLLVSNSTPVRDLDAFAAPREEVLEVLGNRGASGIDGIVSTALGASAGGGRPLVAVLGDLALLHDVNGLLAAREPDAAVCFVVIMNDGGGIFHLLPIREHEPAFTPYFATPHGLDLSHAAALYRVPFTRVSADRQALGRVLGEALEAGGTRVIEVPSDREENRRRRAAAVAAVLAALDDPQPEDGGA